VGLNQASSAPRAEVGQGQEFGPDRGRWFDQGRISTLADSSEWRASRCFPAASRRICQIRPVWPFCIRACPITNIFNLIDLMSSINRAAHCVVANKFGRAASMREARCQRLRRCGVVLPCPGAVPRRPCEVGQPRPRSATDQVGRRPARGLGGQGKRRKHALPASSNLAFNPCRASTGRGTVCGMRLASQNKCLVKTNKSPSVPERSSTVSDRRGLLGSTKNFSGSRVDHGPHKMLRYLSLKGEEYAHG